MFELSQLTTVEDNLIEFIRYYADRPTPLKSTAVELDYFKSTLQSKAEELTIEQQVFNVHPVVVINVIGSVMDIKIMWDVYP